MSQRKQQGRSSGCSFRIESQLGFSKTLGLDEVGRGCLAGPVYAAAVQFDPKVWSKAEGAFLSEINDSKKLSPKKREELYSLIMDSAKCVFVDSVDPKRIDEINILQASFEAFRKILANYVDAYGSPELLLVDGNQQIPRLKFQQHCVVGGDSISSSIAAASIVAKVTRDRWMTEAAEKFSVYGFERNKGYGTKEHWKALEKFGPCELHRRSFLGRLQDRKKGALHEQRVADYLESKGFELLDKNLRVGRYELDLLVRKEGRLHIVEVRTQKDGRTELAFPKSKQQNLKRARQLLLQKRPEFRTSDAQVDLFLVGDSSMKAYWNVYAW